MRDKKKRIRNRLFGNLGKEIARCLFEEGGYTVHPYGYESFLTQIKDEIKKAEDKGERLATSTEQVRSAPDFHIFYGGGKVPFSSLVEVKTRNITEERLESLRLKSRDMRRYKEYWPHPHVVVVVPTDKVFYAQQVSKLKEPSEDENTEYNLESEFKSIEDAFWLLGGSTLEELREIAKEALSNFPKG